MKNVFSSKWIQLSLLGALMLCFANRSFADCITSPNTANAGPNQNLPAYACGITVPITLTGTIGGSATDFQWISDGTGTFSNPNNLNTVYTPGAADYGRLSLTIRLVASGGGCTTVYDELMVYASLYVPPVGSGPSQTVCGNATTVQLAGSSFLPSGYSWSTKGTGTGTFSPNATTLNAVYNPSAADRTNGTVKLTLTAGAANDPCGYAQPMTLTFNKITSQPANKTICENATTTFSVATTSATGVTYQWQVDKGAGYINVTNGIEYSGATTAVLTLKPNVATSAYNNYKYQCLLTNCSPNVVSNAATLTIKSSTLAVTDPTDQSVCAGGSAVFASTTTPGTAGVTYQWAVNTGSGFSNLSNNANTAGATSATLTLSNITSAMQGYTYRLTATNGCATAQVTNAKQLNVSSLSFNAQPQAQNVCKNTTADFSVAVSGDVVSTYQWQVNEGGGFVNISDNATYSGATSASLNVLASDANMNGWLYQCLVKSTCSPAGKTSSSAALTVNTEAVITASPDPQSICEGTNALFNVTVTDGASYSYNWQVDDGNGYTDVSDNADYTNSTTAALTVQAASITQTGFLYRAAVKSAVCSTTVYSLPAQLTVHPSALSIASEPTAAIACEGSDAAFSVTAAGTGISYQWQVDQGAGFADLTEDATYSGVTSSSLNIEAVNTAMNNWHYQAVLSSGCSNDVLSASVALTVNAFTVIESQPFDATAWNNGGLSFECSATGSNLSYQWQAKGNGDLDFSDLSDGSLYSNSNTAILTLAYTAPELDQTAYRCIISSGDCGAPVTSNAATLSIESLTICMVTTDETSGKNKIVFEKPSNLQGVESFYVYRYNTLLSEYELIGNVASNELSTFVDEDADPAAESYQYQVSVVDGNENEFPVSNNVQRTIRLEVLQVGQAMNLSWNTYDDQSTNSYIIYRGLTADAMTEIGTVSGNGTVYTDNDMPVVAQLYYQIALELEVSCNPTARTSDFATVKSNRVEADVMVTSTDGKIAMNSFSLYPNPAKDVVTIKGLPEVSSIIRVFDLSGSAVKTQTSYASEVSVPVSDLSRGMYLIEIQNSSGIARRSLIVE